MRLYLMADQKKVSGNVTVQGDNLKVENLTVNKNLTIGDKVQYSFEAENIVVDGTTTVTDNGTSTTTAAITKKGSITFNNVKLNNLHVSKKDVGISFTNKSSVNNVQLSENAIIESDEGSTIDAIELIGNVTEVEINADVDTVKVNTTAEVTLNVTGKIDTLELVAGAKVTLSKDAKIGDLILPEGVKAEDVIENYRRM